MASSIEKELVGELMTFRIRGEVTNWPILLRIGEMASERWRSGIWAHSFSQKLRRTGSRVFSRVRWRYFLLVKSLMMSSMVAWSFSTRVRRVLRRMYSRRGPQEWA